MERKKDPPSWAEQSKQKIAEEKKMSKTKSTTKFITDDCYISWILTRPLLKFYILFI